MTQRTLGLLMPIPKAIVAQMIPTSSRRKSSWFSARSDGVSPAW